MYKVTLTSVVLIALIVVTVAEIPSYILVCHRSDKKINACIEQSLETIRPQLESGLPDLEIPSLEPLVVEHVHVERGEGKYKLSLNIREINIRGVSNFEVKKIKVDVSNTIFRVGLLFPYLRLTGNFDVDTRILSFPIKGNGEFNANATDCDAVAILKGQVIEENEVKKMNFTDLSIKLKINDYHIEIQNLIKRDNELNKAINDLINEDRQRIIGLATPLIEEKAQEVFLSLANKIVNHFSYDEIFPL